MAVLYHDDNSGPGFVNEAPLLVIEIVSSGNTPEDMERKRLQYLQAGAREVWIIYEKARTMHVFQASTDEFFVCKEATRFLSKFELWIEGSEIFR